MSGSPEAGREWEVFRIKTNSNYELIQVWSVSITAICLFVFVLVAEPFPDDEIEVQKGAHLTRWHSQ